MTRLSKLLAKKSGKPVYVGGDVTFWSPEDESAGLRGVMDTVLGALEETG